MKIKTLICILLALATSAGNMLAQHQLNAVIHNCSYDVNVTAADRYSYTCRQKVEMLNDKAQRYGMMVFQMDSNRELARFSATLKDEYGNVIRTVKTSDLVYDDQSTAHLASDIYCRVCEILPPSYPATLEFEYTVKVKGNALAYHTFTPMRYTETEVRHAEYKISYPETIEIRSKALNIDLEPQEWVEGKRRIKRYAVDNLPPACRCRFTAPLTERVPTVLLAPANIDYHGWSGDMSSWESLGQWYRTLCDDCYALVDDACEQAVRVTGQCRSKREMVERIHRLVQEYTHYVSIQQGIGSHKPAKASMTWQLGYGDCKALTVLTKALLKSVGIDSNEVLVSTTERKLPDGFPNVMQLDHMVLEVPIDEGGRRDTVWLEPSDPNVSAGEIPQNICHHQALEINAGGGRLLWLPHCCDATSARNVLEAEVTIHADGTADVRCDDADRLMNKASRQQYANKIGNEIFVPLSPLTHDYSAFMYSADCTLPMLVLHTTHDHERITFRLPEEYSLSVLPKDISISTASGSLTVNYKYEGNVLTAETMLTINRGEYPATERKRLYDMVLLLCDAVQQKAVFE